MAYATVTDVESRLGRDLSPDEEEQVEILLDDAEAVLRTYIPNMDTLIDTGKLDERLVIMVEVNMVLRVLRNPDAFVSETDGNYSYTRASGTVSGLLEVLPRELDWLGGRGMYQLVPVPPYGTPGEGYTRQPNAHDWSGRADWWVVRVP